MHQVGFTTCHRPQISTSPCHAGLNSLRAGCSTTLKQIKDAAIAPARHASTCTHFGRPTVAATTLEIANECNK